MRPRPFEYCSVCGGETERAGAGDDSIYCADGRGPYCEDCYHDTDEYKQDRESELINEQMEKLKEQS